MMNQAKIKSLLKEMFPVARCELVYQKDYELLLATMLSAQTTDKKVNEVTKKLFSNYSLKEMSLLPLNVIEEIIRPIGTYKRKALYIKEIATCLIRDYDGNVPNNREYIENLPGCGHKTCNVVLSNLFDENCVAVDTHVARVSKRLGIAKENDDVNTIESKLTRHFKNELKDLHHRLVLFGRYICLAKKPLCQSCKLYNYCKSKEKINL